MSTDTQARPDLSALPWDVRLRIAVAETQGATWRWRGLNDPTPFLALWGADDYPLASDGDGLARRPVSYFGPDYPGDPAAWGAVLERERIEVVPGPEKWVVRWVDGGSYIGDAEIGVCVSLAVLAKHSHPDLTSLLDSRP